MSARLTAPHPLADALRTAFRGHPGGVAIATARSGSGPVGLTLSSVASVSVDPPAVVLSVNNGSPAAEGLLAAPSFLVHLLDARHARLARLFATPGADKFGAHVAWTSLDTGEPHLDDVGTVLRCTPLELVRVGASTVVVGEVRQVHADGGTADPMVHVRRRFHRVTDGTVLPE